MGRTFTKIKYASEGAYGTTEYETLYLEWNRTCDIYTLFDNKMQPIITFSDWSTGKDSFTERLIELLTSEPENENSNVEYCTGDEIEILEENSYK